METLLYVHISCSAASVNSARLTSYVCVESHASEPHCITNLEELTQRIALEKKGAHAAHAV